MRLFVYPLTCLLAIVAPVAASPIDPPSADSYVWNNGDAKAFELSWDGTQALFNVQDLGTASYDSVAACCTDTFDRVRMLYPGATLTFSNLAINTMPVDTVFVDNLNLTLLKQGALDNLGFLTGSVTLQWDDPFARMPVMSFYALPEGGIDANAEATEVPEPATLLLVGSGLLGAATFGRRKRRSGG